MLEAGLSTYNSYHNDGYFDGILNGGMQAVEEAIMCDIIDCDNFWRSIGYSLLEKAAEAGFVNIVLVLLKYEKYDAIFADERFNVLYTACIENRVEVVKSLLEHGFDHNMMGEDEKGHYETCLSFASKRGRAPVVTNISNLLLMRGADANLADADNDSPLVWACYGNKIDAARCLLDHGADVNVIGSYGDTPLIVAVRPHNKDLVQLLLEHGADPSFANDDGCTALDYVAEEGSEIAQLIKNVQLEPILK